MTTAALSLAVALCSAGFGQELPPRAVTPAARQGTASDRPDDVKAEVREANRAPSGPTVSRLYMVVGTTPSQDPRELEDKVKIAAKHLDPTTRVRVSARSITRGTSDELAWIFNPEDPGSPLSSQSPGGGEVLIVPAAGEVGAWEITTGDASLRLLSLDLTTAADSTTKSASYKAGEKDKVNAPLRYYKPGLYLLRPEGKGSPKSATMVLKHDKEDKPRPPLTIIWPASDRYFIVALEDFSSDAKRLTEVLKDKGVMGTPFRSARPVETTSLVLADLRQEGGGTRRNWVGNTMAVNIPAPEGVVTSRIWVLFPLTAMQRDAQLQDVNERVVAESYSIVPKLIRERSSKAEAIDPNDPKKGYKPFPISPSSEPRWYELAGDGKSFAGSFQVEDVPGWKASGRLPECYWLMVSEFDNGGDPRPNKLQKVKESEGRSEIELVYALDEEVRDWPTGIIRLPIPPR